MRHYNQTPTETHIPLVELPESKKPVNELRTQDAGAFNQVVDRIHNGALDFSKKETAFYLLLSGIMGYFSYESAKFYLKTGGRGTKFLPIGNFSEEFGGQAAFWCNTSLNWFFVMDTVIDLRNSYYKYKLAKDLGVPISLKKEVTKIIISNVLAAMSGSVMGFLALDNGVYNALVTGGVNFVLSYIGSVALVAVASIVLNYFKNKIYEKCCSALDLEAEPNRSAQWISSHLGNKTSELKAIPNESEKWATLKTPTGYANTVLCPTDDEECESTSLLSSSEEPNAATKFIQFILYNLLEVDAKSTAGKTVSIILHTIMQAFDKIALYGYLIDTIKSAPPAGTAGGKFFGGMIFIPFAILSAKVVKDTTNDVTNLTATGASNIYSFAKNPDWSKDTFIKLAFIIPAAAAGIFGYFISYVSSNTSLALNNDAGWNDWWNVYPTAIGAAVFNGFGFLGILMTAVAGMFGCGLMGYALYNSEKRNVLHRHQQTCSFFQSYPDAVSDIGNQTGFGLSSINSTTPTFYV